MSGSASQTHYQILRISPSATQAEIKTAYHRVLLACHPDKRKVSQCNTGLVEHFSVERIQEAYRTLADLESRSAYNTSLVNSEHTAGQSSSGPRPAQIISLEEFTCVKEAEDSQATWTTACRCGGMYVIREADMEIERHLIACERCSEVVYVGYEVFDEEDESA
ncbi:DnaJ domain-containing protein [Phellopilus nigrolimitatus]|nr:DnaJ domain-containing protein [Phellopilus nigrolimitatus]